MTFVEVFILKSTKFIYYGNTRFIHIIYAGSSFILSDFLAYFIHLYFHKNRFLYKQIHSIHHAEKNPTWISTLVMHPFEMITFYIVYKLPLYCGIPFTLVTFIIHNIVLVLWTFMDHGVDAYTFSAHHKHHRFLKGNYATCLNYWDYVFDTEIN
jgi:sterol desaturase/sphingolipid hydroxylase (fatty acid hydroxylase superfamily)